MTKKNPVGRPLKTGKFETRKELVKFITRRVNKEGVRFSDVAHEAGVSEMTARTIWKNGR